MKSFNFLLFTLILSLASSQGVIETSSAFLLPPKNQTKPAVVIIALNGALCDPMSYAPFFQAVQAAATNVSLWVVLPKFFFDVPFFASTAIAAAISDLNVRKVNTDSVFIAGHSLGGVTGQDYVNENSAGIKGLILLGSYIQKKYEDPQVKFPVPVLSLSGELDGLSKIARLAISFNQMLRHPEQKGHLRYPVAIVPGATHSSFLNGSIPPLVQKSDLKPEIENQEAWNVFGRLIIAFIDVQLNPQASASSEKILLDYVYGVTYPLVRPLIDALTLEGNPHLINASITGNTKWGIDNVYIEMDLSSTQLKTNISIQDYSFVEFMQSKPSVSYENGTLTHKIYARKSYSWLEIFDLSQLAYESADSIAIKYKSSAAVYQVANLSGTPKKISCKDLNQIALDRVLEILPQNTLTRYEKYGVKYILQDDSAYSTGFTWISSDVSYDDKGDYINVASTILYTEIDSAIFPGMFYCKLVSPARIAEWIYTDSLRKNYGIQSQDKEFLA